MRRMSQRALAEAGEVTDSHLSLVINGLQRPSRALAERLAGILGLPVHELFDERAFAGRQRFPGDAALQQEAS